MINVIDRVLDIEGYEKSIGLEGDNKVEVRRFQITEPRLFGFNF